LGLVAVREANAELSAAAEHGLEAGLSGGGGEDHAVDAVTGQMGDDASDEGLVEDGDQGLGDGVGEGPEPGTPAADQYYGVHALLELDDL
jgi:hypothetical protein